MMWGSTAFVRHTVIANYVSRLEPAVPCSTTTTTATYNTATPCCQCSTRRLQAASAAARPITVLGLAISAQGAGTREENEHDHLALQLGSTTTRVCMHAMPSRYCLIWIFWLPVAHRATATLLQAWLPQSMVACLAELAATRLPSLFVMSRK